MAREQHSNDQQCGNHRDPDGQPSDLNSDQVAFEKVIRETLHQKSQDLLDSDGVKALALVAQRYPQPELTLDPIAVELVDSILRIRISRSVRSANDWRTISNEIATLLYEAPDSKRRLERLWNSLLEASQ